MPQPQLEPVVVDPRLLAKAFVARGGRCRRLLAVLAYGRWRLSVEDVRRLPRASQEALGEERYQALLESTQESRDQAAAALPPDAPGEWALVSCEPLDDALRSVLHQAARDLPSLQRNDSWLEDCLLDAALAVAIRLGDEHFRRPVPRYTQQLPQLDYLIHAALLAGAPYLVTNDEALHQDSPSPYYRGWHPQRKVSTVWLSDFISGQVENDAFLLEDVDPEALPRILNPGDVPPDPLAPLPMEALQRTLLDQP